LPLMVFITLASWSDTSLIRHLWTQTLPPMKSGGRKLSFRWEWRNLVSASVLKQTAQPPSTMWGRVPKTSCQPKNGCWYFLVMTFRKQMRRNLSTLLTYMSRMVFSVPPSPVNRNFVCLFVSWGYNHFSLLVSSGSM
jgi:hypothetical protein